MQVSIASDTSEVYYQVYDVITAPFDVAVVLDSDGHDVSGARFTISELLVSHPGILKIDTTFPTLITSNAADADLGQYDLTFGGCAPACEAVELARITYFDFQRIIGYDEVLEVGGLGEEEHPVLETCGGEGVHAPQGGADGGITSGGVVFPDGSLLLNPTPIVLLRDTVAAHSKPYVDCDAIVGLERESLGALKARFHDK